MKRAREKEKKRKEELKTGKRKSTKK